MDQIEQLLDPKRRPPCGHDIEGILGHKVSPARRQRAQTASGVTKPRPVLAPILAAHDQIKFLAKQRMVRVRYPKRSALNAAMRRS
ncbi:hypothetical protein [Variovorax sp. dw_954]|uniref:hypothetical protein n=1 Tax=Variovorax sp. dw_954 TaxID=2720078 RepID=UPI0021168E8D|nr:hypothetical protein [Variovorax sp. dw_954]